MQMQIHKQTQILNAQTFRYIYEYDTDIFYVHEESANGG